MQLIFSIGMSCICSDPGSGSTLLLLRSGSTLEDQGSASLPDTMGLFGTWNGSLDLKIGSPVGVHSVPFGYIEKDKHLIQDNDIFYMINLCSIFLTLCTPHELWRCVEKSPFLVVLSQIPCKLQVGFYFQIHEGTIIFTTSNILNHKTVNSNLYLLHSQCTYQTSHSDARYAKIAQRAQNRTENIFEVIIFKSKKNNVLHEDIC